MNVLKQMLKDFSIENIMQELTSRHDDLTTYIVCSYMDLLIEHILIQIPRYEEHNRVQAKVVFEIVNNIIKSRKVLLKTIKAAEENYNKNKPDEIFTISEYLEEDLI